MFQWAHRRLHIMRKSERHPLRPLERLPFVEQAVEIDVDSVPVRGIKRYVLAVPVA